MNVRSTSGRVPAPAVAWSTPRAAVIAPLAGQRATPSDHAVAGALPVQTHLNLRAASAHVLDIRV